MKGICCGKGDLDYCGDCCNHPWSDDEAVSDGGNSMEWQPIETAPKTSGQGLHVLVYVPNYALRSLIVEAWVNTAHPGSPWVAENGGQIEPSHWMPLPSPPLPAAREAEATGSDSLANDGEIQK